jgi:magnesium chelatase family protein
MPDGAVMVNLAPADIKKVGAYLDLPVAVGMLQICGLGSRSPVRRLFVGELGLTGEVRGVRGALCLALAARDAGFDEIVVPSVNAAEAAAVEEIAVIPVPSLSATVGHILGERPIAPFSPREARPPSSRGVDFADIRGQAVARRALEIAAPEGPRFPTGPPGPAKRCSPAAFRRSCLPWPATRPSR